MFSKNKISFILTFIPLLLFSQKEKSGSEFFESIREMDFEAREKSILFEFSSGNYPQFLTDYEKITFSHPDALGNLRDVSILVSPQYLSIGSKEDHFIITPGPKTAQEIANNLNASLPTPKLVDLIYRAADLKLEPFTYYPRANRNETTDIIYDHSRVIQAQIKAAGFPQDAFISGVKKDIVISAKLDDKKRNHHVIIYGWHKLDGVPIQPETNIHINTYVDYSHGARLISNKVFIDGKEYDYKKVLKDKFLFKLLSNAGEPFKSSSY